MGIEQILLGAQGIQLPDPLEQARKGLSLADLSAQNQIRQYALKKQQRTDLADQALGQIIPDLQRSGWSEEALSRALTHPLVQQTPELAQNILNAYDAQRKSQLESRKTEAQTFKDTVEAKAKAFNDIGAAAFAGAKNPDAMTISQVASMAKFYGVQLPPFSGDPQNPQHVSTYLQGLANASIAAKDQITSAETGRHNLATEGAQAANYASEAERRAAETDIGRQNLELKKVELDPFGILGIRGQQPAASAPVAGGPLETNFTPEAAAKYGPLAAADYAKTGGVAPAGSAPAPVMGAQGLSGEQLLKTVPPALADQVKALAEGRMSFPSGFALKSPYWQAMLSMVAQYDPSFDAVNYNARAKTRADFTSGKSATSLNALNTVSGHLDDLSKAADALKNFGGVATMLNAPINAIESATGDPRVKNFNIARKVVADEMVRAYRASGGSEKDIQEWMSLLNANGSPAQLHENIAQVAHLLESKISALGSQYEQGMGTSSQPIQLVTPKSREVFDRLEAMAKGTKPAATAKNAVAPPKLGEVRDGYLYKGGDPASQDSWEKVNR